MLILTPDLRIHITFSVAEIGADPVPPAFSLPDLDNSTESNAVESRAVHLEQGKHLPRELQRSLDPGLSQRPFNEGRVNTLPVLSCRAAGDE